MKQRKYAKAFVREVGKEDGTLVGAIGSTAAVDRYGEIIDQESWDLKNFKKNPVMLWAHNLTMGEDRPPIGKLTKIKVEDGQLVFNAKFDMADPFAAEIFRKYQEGFLNAFSVGFIPHTIQQFTDKGERLEAPILRDNELLEMSAVPVPANPEALNALRARSFKTKTWNKLMKEVEAEEAEEEETGDEPKDPPAQPTPAPTPEPQPEAKTADRFEGKDAAQIVEILLKEADPTQLKAITDIVSSAVKAKSEDKGGSGSEPKKPQLGGGNLAPIMREATRLLQEGLAEYNRATRK